MKKQPIRIAMIGFDARSLKSFEIFFAAKCNGDYVIDDSNDDTLISIVDIDVVKGKKILKDIRNKFPEQVILTLSIVDHSRNDPRTIHIKKPVDHQDLQQQLGRIRKAITKNNPGLLQPEDKNATRKSSAAGTGAKYQDVAPKTKVAKRVASHSAAAASLMTLPDDLHFVGETQDVDLNDLKAVEQIRYSPSERFQGAVIKAINHARKTGKAVEMIWINTGVIVDPGNNAIFTAVGDSLLRPICTISVGNTDSLVEFPGDFSGENILALTNNPKSELFRWSIEEFIWKIALWSSRGCIPEGTDINAPIFLLEWPNFTRLVNFPHAMRIAALLSQHTIRLRDIPQYLNIPQRYAFAFYSAARAIGVIKISERKIDQTLKFATDQKEIAPRSLLKKLLGRLVGTPGNKSEGKRA